MKRGYNHDDPETDKVEERYGMRGNSTAMARDATDDAKNANKRMQNKAQDQNRELNIRQLSQMRKQARDAKQAPTGIPVRAVAPSQGQA